MHPGAKASGVATSSIRTVAQMPSASRKVASPLSRLMPAPVSTTIEGGRIGAA
jgi:hypothetical protein